VAPECTMGPSVAVRQRFGRIPPEPVDFLQRSRRVEENAWVVSADAGRVRVIEAWL